MAKVEKVQLIDPKRAYNVNIALARFRMTNEAIRDAIISLDSDVLSDDLLATALKAPFEAPFSLLCLLLLLVP